MLSLCHPLQEWIDAEPIPEILSSVHAAPIERLGITAPCVHHLVKQIVLGAVLRVCEAVHSGITRDFDPFWGRTDLPSLDYEELLHANRFAVRDAIRLVPTYLSALCPGRPGPLSEEDFTWLGAALFQEYGRAKQLLSPASQPGRTTANAATLPAATANDGDKWQFQPGKAYRSNIEIIVSGIRWKLLKALVESNHPITVENLIVAGWEHNSSVDDKTVRTHLSELRKLLRKKLELSQDFDPIPNRDHGALSAWELDSTLR